jgi:hypothetical protein
MRIPGSSSPRPFPDGLFFALALAGMAVGASSCGDAPPQPPAERRSAKAAETVRRPAVTEGMTKSEVLRLWGRPDVRVRAGEGERWSYWVLDGRHRLVGKAYVVFDAQDRVSEVVTRPTAAPPPGRHPVTAA